MLESFMQHAMAVRRACKRCKGNVAEVHKLLKRMAERAEQEGRVCKETFVHNTLLHNTLLHMSVALCRGNCWVLRTGLHELTKATGRQFQRGLLHPTADLVV